MLPEANDFVHPVSKCFNFNVKSMEKETYVITDPGELQQENNRKF